jgi:hypothetical protein
MFVDVTVGASQITSVGQMHPAGHATLIGDVSTQFMREFPRNPQYLTQGKGLDFFDHHIRRTIICLHDVFDAVLSITKVKDFLCLLVY